MRDVNQLQSNLFSPELIDLCALLEQKIGTWHDLDMLIQYLLAHDIQDAGDRIQLQSNQSIDFIQTRMTLLNQLVAQLD